MRPGRTLLSAVHVVSYLAFCVPAVVAAVSLVVQLRRGSTAHSPA